MIAVFFYQDYCIDIFLLPNIFKEITKIIYNLPIDTNKSSAWLQTKFPPENKENH